MKNKKGQFERSFTMILTLIVIGIIVFLGYKGILFFVKMQKDSEYNTIINNFNSLTEKYKEYGSYKKTKIILPKNDKIICIFDPSAKEKEKIITEKIEGKEFLQDYWKNIGKKDDNIILYPSKKTFKNDKVYFGKRSVDYSPYYCFKGPIVYVEIEGTGNKIKIKKAE